MIKINERIEQDFKIKKNIMKLIQDVGSTKLNIFDYVHDFFSWIKRTYITQQSTHPKGLNITFGGP